MNSSGNNFQTKQESGRTTDDSRLTTSKTMTTSTTTVPPSSCRQWGAFKNPRIVRVSRSFGGKDRHSKVCTIRGLRDRRIRLSVPTAIQLYDLQDRLGLSQPSKVVDWLLESTKNDIDELPPLPVPPGYFTRFQQPLPHEPHHDLFNTNFPYHHHFDYSYNMRERSKELIDADSSTQGKNKLIASNEEDHEISAQSFFPLGNQSSNLPFNSYYQQWEPNSNLSLANFGQYSSSSSQIEESHQLYFNPIATTSSFQPIVPPYMNNESDLRQLNHFNFPNPIFPTTLSLINSPMKPFRLNDNDDDGDDDDNQPHEGRAN